MARRPPASPAPPAGIGLGRSYTLGPLIGARVPNAYRRAAGDPNHRRLRLFASDPAKSRLEGNIVVAEVPYEPLAQGASGCLFEVSSEDADGATVWQTAQLDDLAVTLREGYDPSEADPRFHQQMVYAVGSLVHRSFRRALGRQLGWGGAAATRGRLRIHPFGLHDENAFYDADAGELRFGYFRAAQPIGRTLAGGQVFTALSHDVIAHEFTHALLDGLRAQFLTPSGPDVAGFHEGFADLVALFHHFAYREALRNAIACSRADLRAPGACFLFEIAPQFGQAGGAQALRSAVDSAAARRRYDRGLEEHDMGEVLLAVLYDAFCTVYRRKTARYVQLATGGSGVLPAGELHPALVDLLTDKAASLAAQFLSILIRAIDYCPPVDLHLGEFLQAMVTADRDLVSDDPWGYREALVDAFRDRGVYLRNVANLSEDALAWKPPRQQIPPIEALSFARQQFNGEPGRSVDPEEAVRQACALGDVATSPEYLAEFGLVATGDRALRNAQVALPQIESIRTVRRSGPDGRVVFDLVAEMTQQCTVPATRKQPGFTFWGGATVIVGPDGEVRYTILKTVAGEDRLARRRAFLEDPRAARFWEIRDNTYVLRGGVARLLHQARRRRAPVAPEADTGTPA